MARIIPNDMMLREGQDSHSYPVSSSGVFVQVTFVIIVANFCHMFNDR